MMMMMGLLVSTFKTFEMGCCDRFIIIGYANLCSARTLTTVRVLVLEHYTCAQPAQRAHRIIMGLSFPSPSLSFPTPVYDAQAAGRTLCI